MEIWMVTITSVVAILLLMEPAIIAGVRDLVADVREERGTKNTEAANHTGTLAQNVEIVRDGRTTLTQLGDLFDGDTGVLALIVVQAQCEGCQKLLRHLRSSPPILSAGGMAGVVPVVVMSGRAASPDLTGFALPLVIDRSSHLARALEVTLFPSFILLDRRMLVVERGVATTVGELRMLVAGALPRGSTGPLAALRP